MNRCNNAICIFGLGVDLVQSAVALALLTEAEVDDVAIDAAPRRASVREAASVLSAAGAAHIAVLVLARTDEPA